MKIFFIFSVLISLFSCNANKQSKDMNIVIMKTSTIEKLNPQLDSILRTDAKVEILADGFEWSEGPLWIEKHSMLLFSDVPKNTIYKWTEENGKEVYLTPSGYTDSLKRGGETGSNGLTLDKNGNLVLCQHGDRRMASMDAPIDKPEPKFITLAGNYENKRFSSPNDAVFNSEGELFFTDPPYGLEMQNDNDPKKEIPFNGVYKVKKNGEIILLTDSITRPNGIAFFPGEKKLLVACSDPDKPNWYIYDVNGDTLTGGRIFHSAAGYSKNLRGLPDGLKIDKNGNVFATGPGGIWIFNKEGKLLGKIMLPEATSNCAFSQDEKILFITNDMYVLRIKMRD